MPIDINSTIKSLPFFVKAAIFILTVIVFSAAVRAVFDWSAKEFYNIVSSNTTFMLALWVAACIIYYVFWIIRKIISRS